MTIRKPIALASGQLVEIAPDWVQSVELSTTFTVPAATLSDVTGVSFVLLAGKTYVFHFELLVTQATATGIVGVAVNYSGTLTRVAYSAYLTNAATAASFQATTTINTALADNAARAIGGPRPTRVDGSITTTAGGTLTLRAQRSAGVTTIIAGTSGRCTAV